MGNIHVRKRVIGGGKYELDGIECQVPALLLREKVSELRLALPDMKIYFNPNTSKIFLEDR